MSFYKSGEKSSRTVDSPESDSELTSTEVKKTYCLEHNEGEIIPAVGQAPGQICT